MRFPKETLFLEIIVIQDLLTWDSNLKRMKRRQFYNYFDEIRPFIKSSRVARF